MQRAFLLIFSTTIYVHKIFIQGRPTTTIAVGDPLEFKLETQDGENLLRDIFATNVIAKDPYSSRTVELIDRRG